MNRNESEQERYVKPIGLQVSCGRRGCASCVWLQQEEETVRGALQS